MGVILHNPLRHKLETLSEGQWFRSAFRQHCGRFLNLDEIGSHGSDAVCMHLCKFRAIHWTPPFLSLAFAFGGANVEPPGFGSPFVFSGYFNGWGEPDLAIAHSGDNTVTVLPVSIKSRRFSGQLALFANPNDPSTYLCAFSQ